MRSDLPYQRRRALALKLAAGFSIACATNQHPNCRQDLAQLPCVCFCHAPQPKVRS